MTTKGQPIPAETIPAAPSAPIPATMPSTVADDPAIATARAEALAKLQALKSEQAALESTLSASEGGIEWSFGADGETVIAVFRVAQVDLGETADGEATYLMRSQPPLEAIIPAGLPPTSRIGRFAGRELRIGFHRQRTWMLVQTAKVVTASPSRRGGRRHS